MARPSAARENTDSLIPSLIEAKRDRWSGEVEELEVSLGGA